MRLLIAAIVAIPATAAAINLATSTARAMGVMVAATGPYNYTCDEFAMAKLHRTASSGAVSPVLPSPAPASHAYSTLWPVAASCPGGSESMGTRAIGSVRAVSRSA